MATIRQTITPFLWFADQAEEAMTHYVSIFPNSRVVAVSRYSSAVPDRKGTVMVCDFELAGQRMLALNAGTHDAFNDAVSLLVECETQDEIDHFWGRLSEGGAEKPCGWLKDRFGVVWQIAPKRLLDLVQDPDDAVASRAMGAMFGMTKIVLADIERAVRA